MQVEQVKEGVEIAIKTGNWAQRNPIAFMFLVVIGSLLLAVTAVRLLVKDKDVQINELRKQLTEKDLQIEKKDKELKEWQTIVVPALRQVAPKVAETKERLDSIINKN